MTPDWRPPSAYVPGRTPRHPDDLFDPIKDGVDAVPVADLTGTLAWRMGLAFLDDGYFWEAHEVLEAVWMACPPNSAEKLLVQSVIQRANARLKRDMDQPKAAGRLDAEARRLAAEAFARAGGPVLGLADGAYVVDDPDA